MNKNNPQPLARSPELMGRTDTALLVIDAQQRLLPQIREPARIVWNIGRLIDGARILGLEVVATEQYPRGLGPTVPELAERLGPLPAKMAFSCGECAELFSRLADAGRHKILLAGIETHVCLMQTALDLMHDGFRVYVAVDATGSRSERDSETALRRMESSGVTLTTTEAALFEWCEVAGTPEFKEISRLVRQELPSAP